MPIGVDEAGRGPVLGSLFVAAVGADLDALPGGIDDSKRLSPARRESLATELRADDRVRSTVIEVSTTEIDARDTDLNGLTVEAAGRAIDGVIRASDEAFPTAIVDACDTDADRFGQRVAAATTGATDDTPVNVIAEHGADETHAIVGAASVVAKVARDAHVRDLAAEHGPLGSGYPSDPETRSFLAEHVREHDALPEFARSSWSTSHDVLAAAEQSALGDF